MRVNARNVCSSARKNARVKNKSECVWSARERETERESVCVCVSEYVCKRERAGRD